jgi:ribosome maturation factor RimP
MAAGNGMVKPETLAAQVQACAEQLATSIGMEIVLIEIKGGSNRPIVRTYIDKPGGVTLEDCERFSKRLSVQLDVEDWIPFSYTLEVSSPGLNRPLVKETDFQRFTGKNAKVRTLAPIDGQRNFKGKILGFKEGVVALEVLPGKQIHIALVEIEKANLMTEI